MEYEDDEVENLVDTTEEETLVMEGTRQHMLLDYIRIRYDWTSTATGPRCSPSALALTRKLAEPYHGQHSLLGAQSVHLGHHDPKAHKGGVSEGNLTKQRKYKYTSREITLAKRKKRRNHA